MLAAGSRPQKGESGGLCRQGWLGVGFWRGRSLGAVIGNVRCRRGRRGDISA